MYYTLGPIYNFQEKTGDSDEIQLNLFSMKFFFVKKFDPTDLEMMMNESFT